MGRFSGSLSDSCLTVRPDAEFAAFFAPRCRERIFSSLGLSSHRPAGTPRTGASPTVGWCNRSEMQWPRILRSSGMGGGGGGPTTSGWKQPDEAKKTHPFNSLKP